jgi:hypothetical protein
MSAQVKKATETKAGQNCFGLRNFNALIASHYESKDRSLQLYGLLDGFPCGYDRLPDEVPPGEVAPPVAEPDFPKYETTFWNHPGLDRSVFGSKAGAACNLLMSPEYMKLICAMLEDVVVLPSKPGCKSDHGTATCFAPPAAELAVPEVVEEVPSVPLEGVLELAVVEPVIEITAKSTLPEFGLMMSSLIVPMDSPDEDFTCALVNWLARTSC